MFQKEDIVVYKGHGLVRIIGVPQRRPEGTGESYYVLRSARAPLSQTKLLVNAEGADKILRYPMSEKEAQEIIDIFGEEAAELPEDPRERMQIIDEIIARNDIKEKAALVRDYRECRLTNLERPEIKKVKAISRNLAEEICHVLKVNRAALRGKLFVKPAV